MIAKIWLLSLALFAIVFWLGSASAQKGGKPSSPAEQGREQIDKLIGRLKSDKFQEREEATRRLMERDDALPALLEVAKSADAEIASRARKAIEAINKRLGKRALRRAAEMLKKGQTDQFVDQAVRWREYMDENCWKAAVDHVRTINDEAIKASEGQFKLAKNLPKLKPMLPWRDVTTLRSVHTDHLKMGKGLFIKRERIVAESVTVPDGFISDSFILCDGPVDLKYSLAYSVVFASGNLKASNGEGLGGIGGCVVVCDGDVVSADVTDSVILCTGNVSIGAAAQNSVIVSGGDVKMGVYFRGATAKNSVIQEHQPTPLHFIHFFDLEQIGIKVKSSRVGVQVVEVAEAKPFARAGIRRGDHIVAVDGVKVDSVQKLRRMLRGRMLDESKIVLTLRREDKAMRVEVGVTGDTP